MYVYMYVVYQLKSNGLKNIIDILSSSLQVHVVYGYFVQFVCLISVTVSMAPKQDVEYNRCQF